MKQQRKKTLEKQTGPWEISKEGKAPFYSGALPPTPRSLSLCGLPAVLEKTGPEIEAPAPAV
jgi:hypothetical protein